jgi:hypothetical protein
MDIILDNVAGRDVHKKTMEAVIYSRDCDWSFLCDEGCLNERPPLTL